jgi:ABC-2 type transport system permease protein
VKYVRDTWLVFHRSMVVVSHSLVWVAITMVQPLSFLVLFGPLLRPLAAAAGPPGSNPFNGYVPGLLIQLALFNTSSAGLGLITDIRSGLLERLCVTPVSRSALLLGRTLRFVVVLVAQSSLLVACATPFGLRIDVVGLLATLGLIVLLSLVIVPASHTLALWLRSAEVMTPLLNTITMPLLLLSGVLLPLGLAPVWLRTIAALNPLSHAVEASRALFNGRLGDPSIPVALALLAALAAVTLPAASRLLSRLDG